MQRPSAALSERKIFHITHLDNLPGIAEAGGLWSDASARGRGLNPTNIAHRHIKLRRRARLVTAGAGGTLDQYVPFNFCPRSVMLFAIHCGHSDFGDGQGQVVHLVSTIERATQLGRRWAFSDRHAELAHAQHFADLQHLEQVDWAAMPKRHWVDVKEARQAEFLVRDFFELAAIVEVVARDEAVATQARQALAVAANPPPVVVQPLWYD
jgi:hypothetical protein